jgi:hypothetical protein
MSGFSLFLLSLARDASVMILFWFLILTTRDEYDIFSPTQRDIGKIRPTNSISE